MRETASTVNKFGFINNNACNGIIEIIENIGFVLTPVRVWLNCCSGWCYKCYTRNENKYIEIIQQVVGVGVHAVYIPVCTL